MIVVAPYMKCSCCAAMGASLHHWDNTYVELQAIAAVKQIIKPWMHEWKGIIIEGDNLSVVNYMKQSMQKEAWQGRSQHTPDISFLSDFHQVLFSHTCRYHNCLADFCADQAFHTDFVWFDAYIYTISLTFFCYFR